MKTINLITAIFLIAATSVMAKTPKPAQKENTYFIRAVHNQQQCLNIMNEMKRKGDDYLSKFWFGCLSGDHTTYGFLTGTSEEDVRNSLPKDMQDQAKITKVEKLTAAQIEEMHKNARD
jgi:hypothetical protein